MYSVAIMFILVSLHSYSICILFVLYIIKSFIYFFKRIKWHFLSLSMPISASKIYSYISVLGGDKSKKETEKWAWLHISYGQIPTYSFNIPKQKVLLNLNIMFILALHVLQCSAISATVFLIISATTHLLSPNFNTHKTQQTVFPLSKPHTLFLVLIIPY